MQCLAPFFPSDLSSWDQASHNKPFDCEKADLISTLNLAKEYSFTGFYPLAAYRCCQMHPEQLVKGITHSRGYLARLTSENLLLCLQSQQKLSQLTLTGSSHLSLGRYGPPLPKVQRSLGQIALRIPSGCFDDGHRPVVFTREQAASSEGCG